jgi:hypothetical protein
MEPTHSVSICRILDSRVKSITFYVQICVQNVTFVSRTCETKELNLFHYRNYKSTAKIGRKIVANIRKLAIIWRMYIINPV